MKANSLFSKLTLLSLLCALALFSYAQVHPNNHDQKHAHVAPEIAHNHEYVHVSHEQAIPLQDNQVHPQDLAPQSIAFHLDVVPEHPAAFHPALVNPNQHIEPNARIEVTL